MACTNCNEKPAAPVKPVSPEATLLYTTSQSELLGRDGARHSLSQPLIPAPHRPRNGWGARFTIKGQEHSVKGSSGKAVFREAKSLFKLNGIRVSDRDLWFNLNIQWLERAVPKYQKVLLDDLLAIAGVGGEAPPVPETLGRRKVGPSEWGRKGWGMLQMYLATDGYDYGKFLGLAEELLSWVNPDVNPTTGCAECFIHFGKAVGELRRKPLFTQDEARRWLVNVMNNVNSRKKARVLSFEEASKINFWS